MTKKKIIFICVTCVLLIAAALCFLMYRLLTTLFENPVVASLPKYESCEKHYSDGFQDYTNYCKYFYPQDKNLRESLEKSDKFMTVTEEDTEEIAKYFNLFEGLAEYTDYSDEYDFDISCIDSTDYFYVENKENYEKYADYPDKYSAFNLYFFDSQTNTLFFIHSNI